MEDDDMTLMHKLNPNYYITVKTRKYVCLQIVVISTEGSLLSKAINTKVMIKQKSKLLGKFGYPYPM